MEFSFKYNSAHKAKIVYPRTNETVIKLAYCHSVRSPGSSSYNTYMFGRPAFVACVVPTTGGCLKQAQNGNANETKLFAVRRK
jgi:hypothetical protein